MVSLSLGRRVKNIEKEKTHAPVQVYLHNTLNPTHIPREARREQRVYPSRPQPKGAIKDWACCFYVQILVWICTKQTDNYYLFWCFRVLPFFLFDWNVADLAQWNNNDFPFQEIKRGLLFHHNKKEIYSFIHSFDWLIESTITHHHTIVILLVSFIIYHHIMNPLIICDVPPLEVCMFVMLP